MIFKDWLFQKFVEWQVVNKQRMTYGEFAEHLGVSRISLNDWIKGKYLPGSQNLSVIAEKLGNEIYSVLGIKIPGDANNFPAPFQEAIVEARRKVIELGLSGDSPETMGIITEALSRHGYELKMKTDKVT
jgi:transcriptional regulator with XRE-family HTH domain